MCRCVRKVCLALVRLSPRFIRLPTNQRDLQRIKDKFCEKGRGVRRPGLNDVTGAVDGTLIKIKKPNVNTIDFMSRKKFAAFNVQIVSGPDNMIYQASVRWPGSVHDSRVYHHSGLKAHYATMRYGTLIGDSAYPSSAYMLIPVNHPNSRAEMRYNKAHAKSRVVVEHTIGIVKARFGLLKHTAIRMTPDRCIPVIHACLVLHNFATERRDHIDFQPEDDDEDEDNNSIPDTNAVGRARRNEIIRNFYSY